MGYLFCPNGYYTSPSGEFHTTGASITPTLIPHQAGDVIFIFLQTAADTYTFSPAQGFQQIGSDVSTGSAGASGSVLLAVWWVRATSSSMTAPTINSSGDHIVGQVHVVRGIDPNIATPYVSYTTQTNSSSTTASFPSVDVSYSSGMLPFIQVCMSAVNSVSTLQVTAVNGMPAGSNYFNMFQWQEWGGSVGSGGMGNLAYLPAGHGDTFSGVTFTLASSSKTAVATIMLPEFNRPVPSNPATISGRGGPQMNLVSAGTVTGASISTLTPAYPSNAGAAGDLCLLVVESANQSVSLSSAQGYQTLIATTGVGTAGGTSSTAVTVFYKWLETDESSETAPTIADAGDHVIATYWVIPGVQSIGQLATSTQNTGSTTMTWPSVSVGMENAVVLHIGTSSDDSTTTEMSTATWLSNSHGDGKFPTCVLNAGNVTGNGGQHFFAFAYCDGGTVSGSTSCSSTFSHAMASIVLYGPRKRIQSVQQAIPRSNTI